MMKLLLLFLLLAIHLSEAKPSDPALASNSTFLKNLVKLLKEKKPKTFAEFATTNCFAAYCHFEDKNGCGSACETYGNLPFLTDVKDITGPDGPLNVAECEKECVGRVQHPPNATVACSVLCTVDFSYLNRGEWIKDTKQGAADFKKTFKDLNSLLSLAN